MLGNKCRTTYVPFLKSRKGLLVSSGFLFAVFIFIFPYHDEIGFRKSSMNSYRKQRKEGKAKPETVEEFGFGSKLDGNTCLKRSKMQKQTFYSHITKAGGTSINLLLLREAQRRNESFEGNSRALYKRTGEYLKKNAINTPQERTIWASELPFRNFGSVVSGAEWFKFVILREPLDRFNSHRQMRANIPKSHWDDYRSNAPAVKKKLISKHKNLQCRYVSTFESSCNTALKSWDLVLLFEEFDVSVAMICIFLNISTSDCCLPKVNTRKKDSFPLPELTETEVKYFKRVNSREISLYQDAKKIFEVQRECRRSEIDLYLSKMLLCMDTSGVRVNPGSE